MKSSNKVTSIKYSDDHGGKDSRVAATGPDSASDDDNDDDDRDRVQRVAASDASPLSSGFIPGPSPLLQQRATQPGAVSIEGTSGTSHVTLSRAFEARALPELPLTQLTRHEGDVVIVPIASVVCEDDDGDGGGPDERPPQRLEEREIAEIAIAEKHPENLCYIGGRRIVCGRGMLAAITAVVALAAVAVGLSFGLARGDQQTPSLTNSERLQAIRRVILPITPDDEIPSLDEATSPRRRALEWIADYDEIRVSPEDADRVVQRYVLALLYFATAGEDWISTLGFLETSHECSLREPNESAPQLAKMISCDDDHRVTDISLPVNNLRGSIPEETRHLTRLTALNLGGNAITGNVPAWLGTMPALTSVHLGKNHLGGGIPPTLGSSPALTFLSLHTNDLTGTIPEEIGNIATLETLTLSLNRLTGTLPTSLLDLSNLTRLFLYGNDFEEGSASFLCNGGLPLTDLELDCNMGCDCCTKCH